MCLDPMKAAGIENLYLLLLLALYSCKYRFKYTETPFIESHNAMV